VRFFEQVRIELERYDEGVHDVPAGASLAALGDAERRLGTLPEEYASFLRSYDGLSLFHDTFTVAGTGAALRGADGALWIGEGPEGRVALDESGRVYEVRESGDRVLAGTSLERWLTALLKREGQLIGSDGEWKDVFGSDGALLPEVRQKRSKVGQKVDPEAAVWHLEAAELAYELKRATEGDRALARALAADPGAAEAWDLLAGRHERQGRFVEAAAAYERAAEASPATGRGLGDRAPRALRYAKSARAARFAGREDLRARAKERALSDDPEAMARLSALARERTDAGDPDGAAHLGELAAAIGGAEAEAQARALKASTKLKTVT
jgi:tetratricopeptide (TPR) repeat protein